MKGAAIEKKADHIDALDGLRATAALLVLAFHYWQQSWVSLSLRVFGYPVDLSFIVTSGALGVEILFMLSGFCLFYPLAMHPEKRLHIGNYVWKRVVRILPTYFLCVIISAAYQIGRLDAHTLREQFIANMTLTQMRNPAVAYNQLNGVLWSIAIEAQFYLVFPLLAAAFRKKPWLTLLGACLISEAFRLYLRDIDSSQINFLMNQLPAVLDTFVAGMAAAQAVAAMKRALNDKARRALGPAFALGLIAFILFFLLVTTYLGSLRYSDIADNQSRLRLNARRFTNAACAGMLVCAAMGTDGVRAVFGNRVARFLGGISYQIYLWHAWIALRLKDFHIPPYATERPMDDTAWRRPYLLMSLALTLIVSTLMTYGVERPISRAALRHAPRWARPPKEVPSDAEK